MRKTKPNSKNQKTYKPLNVLNFFMTTYDVKNDNLCANTQTRKRISRSVS